MKTESILNKGSEQNRIKWEKDVNFTFLSCVSQSIESQQQAVSAAFTKQIKAIKIKLEYLQLEEKEQWSEILLLKCKQLFKLEKKEQLKNSMRILVFICNQLKIAYDRKTVEQIIKKIYYQQYGERIVQKFKQSEYSIEQFEVLTYTESYLTRFFNFFF